MSALGLDEVSDPRGVLAYAPRKPRNADDESTIRPVLERLSRSEGRVPGPRLVRKAQVTDLPPPQVEAVARSAFPMTARLAVAAGVLALVGAAAAGYFAPPAADHAATAPAPTTTGSAPSALPKPVQTLSIQRPADAQAARLVKDDARMPQPASARAPQASAAAQATLATPLRSASSDPSLTPLKAWAALPTDAADWSASTPAAATTAQATADSAVPAEAAAKPEAKAPVHKTAPAHHTRHAARHRVTQHRRHRTARAAPKQAHQSAQAAETQPAQAQPVKKLPLQAAIDRVFGAAAAPARQ
jgi:hypothetical protein